MTLARDRVIEVLQWQAETFPAMAPASVSTKGLDTRDARLALAIHRSVLQRWLTLQHILNHPLRQPFVELEYPLRAILLAGAAQLLFMQRIPAHAVVDDAVEHAKRRVRAGAASLTNAVLRRVAELVVDRHEQGGWQPAPNMLPWEAGRIELAEPLLPDIDNVDAHWSIATSHPLMLIHSWRERFDTDVANQLFRHSLVNPPTIVRFSIGDAPSTDLATPHRTPGYALWRATHKQMVDWLDACPHRWVQDTAAAMPVDATAGTRPQLIVDLCAGRGTKTRQLAALHPESRIVATETHGDRLTDLRKAFAHHPRVEVFHARRAASLAGQADLVLLDVPCSNTGVLARRHEARYRVDRANLTDLANRQRQIIEQGANLLRRDPQGQPAGTLLYSTCSIEPIENERQSRWIAQRFKMSVQREQLILPGGRNTTYHDGGYFAVMC